MLCVGCHLKDSELALYIFCSRASRLTTKFVRVQSGEVSTSFAESFEESQFWLSSSFEEFLS